MGAIATALKHMLAAGMDEAAIVAAVADMEANMPKQRSSAAIRQERYRRNKASQSVTSDVSDGSDAKPRARVEDKTSNSEIEPQEKGKSASRRATRLPVDFVPDLELAMGNGLSLSQAQREAEKFRAYWTAKAGAGATKLDWPATWRLWSMRAADDAKARGSPKQPETVSTVFRDLALMEEYRNEQNRNLEPFVDNVLRLPGVGSS